MTTPSQEELNEAVESVLRVCHGFSLVTCCNIFSAAMLNISALTSEKENGGKSKDGDVYAASLFLIETITVQTRDTILQLRALRK